MMSGSYRQCPDCGKRALRIATRCPGCGRELPPRAEPRRGPVHAFGRYVPWLAAVLIAGAVLVTAVLGRFRRTPLEESSSVAAATRVDTTTAAGSPAASGPAGRLLVARTWTHVRNRRSVAGELEAVLLPGDTVLADSLSRGWYRVALEGEVLGYAHRSTLVGPH
jgi:rRNA maturation protein Nop10